ncbi:MAG: PAS domain-containing sensor histidine kinase [Spirochaetia bacterium]|nr:PAS domain-containing sensor histidine kinase [Spirochaetia bacterium]
MELYSKDSHRGVLDKLKIRNEQIRHLSAGTLSAGIGNLVVSGITAYVLRNQISFQVLTGWILIFSLIQSFRIISGLFLRNRKIKFQQTMFWIYMFRSGAFFTGAAWGVLPLLLLNGDIKYQVYLSFVMAGVTGAATASLSIDRKSAIFFNTSAILMLITALVLDGGEIRYGMSAMLIVYILFLTVSAVRGEKLFINTLSALVYADSQNSQLVEAQHLAHIGSWSADLKTGDLIWSDEIFRIFGYAPGSFKPALTPFLDAVHPEDRDRVREIENNVRKSGGDDVVHRIIRPDGTIRHVHEIAEGEFGNGGNLLSISGTIQDISEMIEYEEALIKARDEAEVANRAKSDFLSRMSHELRTPLNAILGFSQLLISEDKFSDRHKVNLNEINFAGHHLLELIDEVLDLSSLESGKLKVSIETVKLKELIDESISLLKHEAEKNDIKIISSIDDVRCLKADRFRLKQALLNLLTNAVRYNTVGGKVSIDCLRLENNLRIIVSDTGAGISEEHMKEIFTPFNRLDIQSDSVEGTGIGLAFTKKVVELMDGSVGAESRPGEGSTFWLEIPEAEC